jgi:HTH-type transcriptional repressor of NAD biosynthesis genes
MKKVKIGLVLGKFMPLQIGHEFLLQFAKQFCEVLVVIVDCLDGQTMTPEERKADIEDAVPGVIVVALGQKMPQFPDETPEFWPIWRKALLEAVQGAAGGSPDMVFASDTYGWELAKQLGARFVQCDIQREGIPISASMVRRDPMTYWRYISMSARKHFLKKVCFMGPESTGKSTAALKLARHFDTAYVPEYAKAVIAEQDGEFFQHNVELVAMSQLTSERALERMTNRLLVCDTDPLTTLIWSEFLYGEHPAGLDDLVRESHYDLTFLFEPDVPWVQDIHRSVVQYADALETRQNFLELCKKWLHHFGREYVSVKGSYENRFNTCVQHCEALTAGGQG